MTSLVLLNKLAKPKTECLNVLAKVCVLCKQCYFFCIIRLLYTFCLLKIVFLLPIAYTTMLALLYLTFENFFPQRFTTTRVWLMKHETDAPTS